MKSKYVVPLCILVLCMFIPFEARADGISIPILFGGGFIVFTPVILFISVLEAAIIFKPLKLSFRYGFKIMLVANILSMLSGIPVKILNMIFYGYTMPDEIYEFFKVYPYLVGVGTLFYFVVTLIVEYLFLRHVYLGSDKNLSLWMTFKKWLFQVNVTSFFTPVEKKSIHHQNRRKLVKWLLIANIASYSIMAPLNYYVTKPTHDIKEFTPDSSWAKHPVTPIYFIDPETKCLATIMSDGTGRRIIGDEPVKEFYVDYNGKRYYSKKRCAHDENSTTEITVYRGLGSSIWIQHKGKRFKFAINPGLLHFGIHGWSAALLSNGKEVVFCDKDYIYLMDIEKKRIGKITSGTNFVLPTPLFEKKPEE